MNRVFGLLFVCLILILAPMSAGAQSIPGLSALTGLGGGLCGLSSCLSAHPSLFAAYSDNPKGVTFGLSADGQGSQGLFTNAPYLGNTRRYRLQGVWFGGALPLSMSQDLSATLRGAYFVPVNKRMTEDQDWSLFGIVPIQVEQGWRTSIQWWNVEGEAAYRVADSFSFLGGFRYDTLRTKFSDDAPPVFPFSVGLTGAESDLDLYLYLPYVGGQVENDWGGGRLKTRVIGFPYIPGQAKFATTRNTLLFGVVPNFNRFETSGAFKSGYFLETSAEYGVRVGGLLASVFAKYEFMHGVANVSLDRDQQVLIFSVASSSDFTLSYDRRLWTVGGSLEVAFTSPF